MIKIELKRMGMDFYEDEVKQVSDMENFRLRPAYADASEDSYTWKLKDKKGRWFAMDFMLCRPTKYKPEYRLGMAATCYGKDGNDSKVYVPAKEMSEEMKPTLANIKKWLEMVLGDEVELTIERSKK